MNIKDIVAREILDSRGNPTVEAEVWLDSGLFGRASVPAGASTGKHEAHELRDGGDAYDGHGVKKAIANITGEIKAALLDQPADRQLELDEKMIALDGTSDKSRLGANAILAVSLASAQAAAAEKQLPLYIHVNDLAGNPTMSLPTPMINVLNGGKHASNSADFQEYMLIPLDKQSYRESIQMIAEIFTSLKANLSQKGQPTTVGDEGGFAPRVVSNTEMLNLLQTACEAAGYQPGEDVAFALDVAASEFFKNNHYCLATESRELNGVEMIGYLKEIVSSYPIVSIEDGLAEDAWDDWTELTSTLSDIQLVGDDLLVTNQERLEKAIAEKAGNAILIKPNQIGTLSETISTIAVAKKSDWNTVVSHRSGETEDVTIAHLAIGTGAGQIKTGSVSRGERVAKHNELMRIEERDPEISLAKFA